MTVFVTNAPKILAIETSTEICAVGLLSEDKILTRLANKAREHTRLLLPMIEEILLAAKIEMQDLDVLACTVGPGSFTAIRIGTAAIQAFSYTYNTPVIAISSLRAVAQDAWQKNKYSKVFACLNAGLEQVYAGLYHLDTEEIMQLQGKETLMNPKNINLLDDSWVMVEAKPTIEAVLSLALADYKKEKLLSAEEVQPVYLDNWGTRSN